MIVIWWIDFLFYFFFIVHLWFYSNDNKERGFCSQLDYKEYPIWKHLWLTHLRCLFILCNFWHNCFKFSELQTSCLILVFFDNSSGTSKRLNTLCTSWWHSPSGGLFRYWWFHSFSQTIYLWQISAYHLRAGINDECFYNSWV